MASTYALPVNSMPQGSHNHFRQQQPGHGHSHSLSLSKPRATSPSKLAPEGARTAYTPKVHPNGSMHSHSRSAHANPYSSSASDGHIPAVSPVREDSEDSNHSHVHSNSTSIPPNGARRKSRYMNGHTSSPSMLYQELTGIATELVGEMEHKGHNHGHSHDHDHDHDHSHGSSCGHSHAATAQEPKSRVTKMLLRHTKKWSLIQSILLEKDSRRIFYFMT